MTLSRRLTAEALGTAFLLAAVVGSGIMGERLSGGSVALALLANTVATGAALVALILSLAPISGAHLNPAVSVAAAIDGELPWRDAAGYVLAQIIGALAGVALAHLMFELPLFSVSQHARAGSGQLLSEVIATFGLLLVIKRCARSGAPVAVAVGAYIVAAYWFTASTSFANPAVTIARSMSDTFAGIRPADVPAFILSQLIGAALALAMVRWFDRDSTTEKAIGRDTVHVQTPRAVSVHRNSARSQMAEGCLRHLAADRFDAISAGIDPTVVNPLAIRAMAEIGIDISQQHSKSAASLLQEPVHLGYVITVCDNAKERCPIFPGVVKQLHWSLEDPAAATGTDAERLAVFQRVRDEIAQHVRSFVNDSPV